MSRTDLPAHVAEFLAAHVSSLEDLELLVLMADAPERWWDAQTAADELRVLSREAELALERLARNNLLEVRLTNDVRYRFRPGTESLLTAVRELVDAYRAHPIAVVRQLSPDLQRIRDFSDAFRIRHDR